MARPTKMTPVRVKKLLDAVRLGQPLTRAASAGGIGYETFREWREQSVSFREQLDEALAEGELAVLGRLRVAMDEGSVPAMFGWLERRFPDEWSRGERLKQEISSVPDLRQVIRQVVAVLDEALPRDPETRRKVAEKLMELDTEPSPWRVPDRSGSTNPPNPNERTLH